jgi:hypothetical protein
VRCDRRSGAACWPHLLRMERVTRWDTPLTTTWTTWTI